MKLYIGIDWSSKKHDICFMNNRGGVIQQIEIEHKQSGLLAFEKARQAIGVPQADCYVGIETARNLFLDFLQAQGYTNIYILAPHLVHGNRSRFAVSRGHNDASDAKLIAEILRTDQGHLIPWQADSLITQQIRAMVRLIDFLTVNMVRINHRLRDVLVRYYPQATVIFNDLDAKVNLAFIKAYPTPAEAKALDFETFKAFCKAQRYPKPQNLSACYGRLFQDFPNSNLSSMLIFQEEAPLLAEMLLKIKQLKEKTQKELTLIYQDHPDNEIYQSLPGLGNFLEPALLSKMGDNRNRYSTPEMLQAVAGTCPVTFSSGKRKSIRFRKACDHDFRRYVQIWAKESIKTSPWAYSYFESILPHSKSTSHAYRCLANRWLRILWRLWVDRVPYDEAYHLKQRAKFTFV